MVSKEEIEKLKGSLEKGDQKVIAEFSGLSTVTVNKFFNGKEHLVSEEMQLKIVEATADVIKDHKRRQAKANRILKSI